MNLAAACPKELKTSIPNAQFFVDSVYGSKDTTFLAHYVYYAFYFGIPDRKALCTRDENVDCSTPVPRRIKRKISESGSDNNESEEFNFNRACKKVSQPVTTKKKSSVNTKRFYVFMENEVEEHEKLELIGEDSFNEGCPPDGYDNVNYTIPCRTLDNFIIFDVNNKNRIASIEEIDDLGKELHAAGIVKAIYVDEDDEELIKFLHKQEDLKLDNDDLEIIRNEKITGHDFLQFTEEKLCIYGMKGGPASRLADFVKEVKEKKLKPYSSYRTLKNLHEVLKKHGIDSKNIADIPQFKPVVDNNEAMRCEYISSILHSAIHIVKSITKRKITISPQFEVIGEENTGHVDYAIKKILDDTNILEELVCITEGSDWYFILYTSKGIWCTSKSEYHISLTEASLDDDTRLCQGVKEVMEAIVGLLKDRVSVNDEPATKRHCVEGKTKG
ncbi:10410_t:CDS:2 [Entrophospora sp. SA101]|nr:10410_t:CDS:2 [Entrophospora sp. SA101]